MDCAPLTRAAFLNIAGLCITTALACAPARIARGLDLAAPANVRVVVKDDQGKPVEGAAVRLMGMGNRENGSVKSDAAGVALLHDWGQGKYDWPARLMVEKAGLAPEARPLALFPGAQIEEAIGLAPVRQTWIRVLGPEGQPLPQVAISMEYRAGGVEGYWPVAVPNEIMRLRTDEKGEYVWEHRPLDRTTIWAAGHREFVAGNPAEVVVRVSAQQMVYANVSRSLQGRVLLHDGTPAKGWCVAQTGGRYWGGATFLGTSMYMARGLKTVGEDGAFQLAEATRGLVLISPQGAQVAFDLEPATWEPGERKVTLHLPAMAEIGAVVVDGDGKPVAGEEIVPWPMTPGTVSWTVGTSGTAAEALVNTRGEHLAVRTDREGRFGISLPVGTSAGFNVTRPGWKLQTPQEARPMLTFSPIGVARPCGSASMKSSACAARAARRIASSGVDSARP